MKGVMTREAYYNQEVAKNIVLMELGGDVTPSRRFQTPWMLSQTVFMTY